MQLAIYLNNQLAGATAGRADPAHRGEQSGHELAPFLEGLAREVQKDRESLLAIMRALGIRVDPIKVPGGWVAEPVPDFARGAGHDCQRT